MMNEEYQVVVAKHKPLQTVIKVFDNNFQVYWTFWYKDHMPSFECFTYKCHCDKVCNYQIRLNIKQNFEKSYVDHNIQYYQLNNHKNIIWLPQDERKHHTCNIGEIIEEKKESANILIYKKDKETLERYVESNPVQTAKLELRSNF